MDSSQANGSRKPKLSLLKVEDRRQNSIKSSSVHSGAAPRSPLHNRGRRAALVPHKPKEPPKTLVLDILKKRSHQYHGYDPISSAEEGHGEIQILIKNERMKG